MQKLYSIVLSLFILNSLFAKDVDVNYARQVATNFYTQNNFTAGAVTLTLAYECREADGSNTEGNPVYYIFNVQGQKGFVIVAADDLVEPVLAYNTTGSFSKADVNPSAAKWIENYKKQIVFVKHNITTTTDLISQKWIKYYNNQPVLTSAARGAQAVNPLCQTQWNQAPNENGLCPFDNGYGARTVTGCVATAMAQVMKFWNYPPQGVGNHSYNDRNYGTLAANFGNTTYNWGGMPNTLSSANNDVATLMSHCGISVDMNYGVAQTGGSSAYVVASESPGQACAEYSYKTYFGYDPATIQGIVRRNYTDADWINAIKGDLDAGRPIQYAGFGNGGGHTWVCDGYDQNNLFHQNWGWGGNSDGYFSLNNLDPTSLGAGGGTGGFNTGQQALIGIKPLNNGGGGGGGTINQGTIALYAATTVTANPFQSGGSFTVYTDIANLGNTSFTGDFAAAVFDDKGVFVKYIEELQGRTAQAQMHYQVQFTTAQLSLIPGTYLIGLYYKNSSSNYSLIPQASYFNPVSFTVTGPYNDIQMSAATTLIPGTFVKNQSVEIKTQMYNNGNNFSGSLSADLFTLDGTFVTNIEAFTTTLSAQTNYDVTFVSNGLNVAPGSYLIAYFAKPTGATNYSLVYTTSYPNPVDVTIVDVALSPDMYENNNTENSPYAFTPSFNGNNASVLTSGSNMHIGNDYDYYSITLPGGTNYSINARVHDSYSSDNGNTYTNDAQFSYSVNGGTWSSSYDDVMGAPIYVQGGGSVKFFVADYFTGTEGTYLLDLQITRGQNVGVNDFVESNVSIYPNPAHDILFINAGDAKGSYDLKVFNTIGEQMSESSNTFNGEVLKTDISALAAGIYTLQLKTEAGISNTKFIVK